MSKMLGKQVYPWNTKISLRNKESTHWIVKTTVGKERDRVRNSVNWTIWVHPLVCERKEERKSPHEVHKLKKYIWTLYWPNWEIHFDIRNISSWWMQIFSKEPLNVWEEIELTFRLDKKYGFNRKIVWWKWNLYWIQFIVDHNSLDSVKKNFFDLIKLLTSVNKNYL